MTKKIFLSSTLIVFILCYYHQVGSNGTVVKLTPRHQKVEGLSSAAICHRQKTLKSYWL
jgi:hypothetical protein